jgi:hypothetical protein
LTASPVHSAEAPASANRKSGKAVCLSAFTLLHRPLDIKHRHDPVLNALQMTEAVSG